ncbi:hypothetical protein HK102_001620, partial [Quaeritorhiza haematococci]
SWYAEQVKQVKQDLSRRRRSSQKLEEELIAMAKTSVLRTIPPEYQKNIAPSPPTLADHQPISISRHAKRLETHDAPENPWPLCADQAAVELMSRFYVNMPIIDQATLAYGGSLWWRFGTWSTVSDAEPVLNRGRLFTGAKLLGHVGGLLSCPRQSHEIPRDVDEVAAGGPNG